MSEALRVGIAGLGTVGASVLKILRDKGEMLTRQCGKEIIVTAVSARDAKRDRGVDFSSATWFDDPVALAKSNNIDVFIELIGGDEGPARASVEAALRSGRHVVTANKALLAKHGVSLSRGCKVIRHELSRAGVRLDPGDLDASTFTGSGKPDAV